MIKSGQVPEDLQQLYETGAKNSPTPRLFKSQFIDKIVQVLATLQKRLSESVRSKGTWKQWRHGVEHPFAGLNLVVAGDFWQFGAVKATSLFQNPFARGHSIQVGVPTEGDSWCAQNLLKQRWQLPGVRKVAEETILNCARLLRAFANLDQNLTAGIAPGVSLREAGRRPVPPPPPVPDRPRSRERSRSRRRRRGEEEHVERSPLRRSRRGQELHPKSAARHPSPARAAEGPSEESEEEETREEDPPKEVPPVEVKRESRSQPPPEPKYPPKRKRSQKKKKRGGRKHQQHGREVRDPFKRSHTSPAEEEEDVEEEERKAPSRREVGESLRKARKPTVAQMYYLAEAEFWRQRHVPAGSVIVFSGGYIEESSLAECAVLVKERESTDQGIWLKVKTVGCSDKAFQKTFTDRFKRGRTRVHLCYGEISQCTLAEEDGVHIDRFTWFPPGDFGAKWLTTEIVAEGTRMALAELEAARQEDDREGDSSKLEQRLNKLKEKIGRRVTFDGTVREFHRDYRAGGDQETPRGGITRRADRLPGGPLALTDVSKVKKEDVESISDSEERSKKDMKKKPRKTVEDRLVKAVADRRKQEEKKDRREKKRSRSRRSRMFKLLEDQAMEQLAQEGVLEEEYMADTKEGKRPKIFTYFQLALKPGLDSKSRDCREISLLSRCLDLLREGRLANLADTLAARLLAVETATRQGWATARHLEVYGPDEEGPVPPHILLSAQRHQRQVEKAGGKGSWTRGQAPSWSDWSTDARAKGKGKDQKGKGKKGKGKPKGKGGGDHKAEEAKPKPGDA
eukprot:s3888_g2.t1